jgi:hypothetical protein
MGVIKSGRNSPERYVVVLLQTVTQSRGEICCETVMGALA